MGFSNFGVVSFTDQSKVADFVTYLKQGKVMTTKCKQCGRMFFPPRADCPDCVHSEVEWFAIEGSGKLATYTTVNYGPSGFENDAPYTLAIVDFSDGLRVFGRVSKDINPAEIKVGMDLKVAPSALASDRVGYEFKKA
jgi:uncharacterized OB-fold protein